MTEMEQLHALLDDMLETMVAANGAAGRVRDRARVQPDGDAG